MSAASKALRRQLEVTALFDEAQGRGREWLEGALVGRGRLGLARDFANMRVGYRSWADARRRALEARDEALFAFLRAGATHAQAASRFSLSISTVKTYEARARLWPREPIAQGRDAAIVRLIDAGVHAREVGRRFDLSERGVYNVLERVGARARLTRPDRRAQREAPLLAAFAEGLPYRAIADRFGVKLSYLKNVIARAFREGRLERRRITRATPRAA